MDLAPYERLVAIGVVRDLVCKWWGAQVALADAFGEPIGGWNGTGLASSAARPPTTDQSAHDPGEALRAAAAEMRALRPPRPTRQVSCGERESLVLSPIDFEGEFACCVFAWGDKPTNGVPSSERLQELLAIVAQQVERVRAEAIRRERAITLPPREIVRRYRFDEILGRSRPMQDVFALLEKIVESDATVLIQGESGTGKELVARAIHYNGPRARRPFVAQNCSAFNDNLLESALFGHTRGAFTGAVRDKKGLFEVADGGTFFLDEIGDMSPALQTKLLRVLEEGSFTPVGCTETRHVDVRLVAATHKDLQAMVERGEFREDLYYRVHVIRVSLPALRERLEDLPILVDCFIRKHHRGKAPLPRLADGTIEAMSVYHWPGNIRELENEIERMLVVGGEVAALTPDLLSPRILQAGGRASRGLARFTPRGTLREALELVERDMIREGLARTRGNRSKLARDLGVSRSNLILKIERYGLEHERGF